jgi:hypothetical protein
MRARFVAWADLKDVLYRGQGQPSRVHRAYRQRQLARRRRGRR